MRLLKKGFLLFLGVITMTMAQAVTQKAIFAGGCFWCMESDFEKVPGVTEVISGYTGGRTENPSYEEVSHKETGHYEAVLVIFDPNKISYNQLLSYYWKNIDPEDDGGQFCDRGNSYKSAIFYLNDQQKSAAEISKQAIIDSREVLKVVTPIIPASTFYPAEEYHQSYYQKNPIRYKFYRYSCGRDARLAEIWGS